MSISPEKKQIPDAKLYIPSTPYNAFSEFDNSIPILPYCTKERSIGENDIESGEEELDNDVKVAISMIYEQICARFDPSLRGDSGTKKDLIFNLSDDQMKGIGELMSLGTPRVREMKRKIFPRKEKIKVYRWNVRYACQLHAMFGKLHYNFKTKKRFFRSWSDGKRRELKIMKKCILRIGGT
jgi:hypothetical protein